MNVEETPITGPDHARHYAALMSLTRSGLGLSGDDKTDVRQVTETVASALGVERVSLWRFSGDRSAIVCHDLFEVSGSRHSSGTVLRADSIPAYFRAMAENEVISADDALSDASTKELTDNYLGPLGISSMLDVPVLVAGVLDGVLCCEHVGPARRWTDGERSFAISVANLVALMLTQCARAQSEARLRAIFEHEPECVRIVDLQGRVVDMNPAGLRMIEAEERRDVMGKPVTALIHPADRAAFMALHDRVGRGETGQMRFRVIGLKGTERWMETHSTPLREADGALSGVLSVTRDVTEQTRTENVMLRVARSVSLPIGEGFLDELTRHMVEVLSATGGALALFDPAQPGRLRTRTFVHEGRIIDNVSYEIAGTPCEQVIPGAGRVFPREVRELFPHDGMLVEFGFEGFVGAPLLDQDGAVIGLASVFHRTPIANPELALSALQIFAARAAAEIGRQTASREWQVSQRQQRLILDSVGEGILGLDTEGRIVFENRVAQALLGWAEGEMIGRNSHALMHHHRDDGRPYPEEESPIHRTLRDGAVRRIEDEGFFRKDASSFPVEYVCSPVRDGVGAITGAVLSFRDITERKRMEQHLLRSQRMESIGTLAGGIAHDLNNVLAPILLAIGLLKSGEQDEGRLTILSRIEGSAQRGADLIRQVLSFARGVEGKPATVKVELLARDIERIVHDTFPKNIAFELTAPPDLWLIHADPTQLHQVLMNLCVNARDAMPKGGRLALSLANATVDEVYASLHPQAKPGRYVVIKVEDNGTGMQREIQDRIFEPFFTTKEIGKGTGLGLSTVLTIVRSQGGFITLYSEPGQGARFKVHLPAIFAPAETPPDTTARPGLPRGRGETVLLVDDEATIREVGKKILERFNYRVLLASDGAEAVALYTENRADIAVVLTDMAMPVMDGPATIAALRALDPTIKIVGSSGLTSHGELTRTEGLALDGFIPKPYAAEAMLTTLAEVLSGTPA